MGVIANASAAVAVAVTNAVSNVPFLTDATGDAAETTENTVKLFENTAEFIRSDTGTTLIAVGVGALLITIVCLLKKKRR